MLLSIATQQAQSNGITKIGLKPPKLGAKINLFKVNYLKYVIIVIKS